MSKSPSQREFLGLAVPNMLAAMAVPVAEFVDLAFLGHLQDVTPLSGVVLSMVIFDYLFWSFGFLRMGTTGLVAQAVGRGDKADEAALFWRAVLLGGAIGLVLTLLQTPLASASFALLAGGAEVEAAGRDYFDAHIWGAIPTLIGYAIFGWLLGRGRGKEILILTTIWQLTNIGLNYLFIIEYGWGAAGAGYAIAISEGLTLLISIPIVIHVWGGIPPLHWHEVLHWGKASKLMLLNGAIMGRTFVLMTVLASFTNISASFGAVPLAANALMMKLFVFYAFICDGFAIALETFAGHSLGSGNKERLKRSFTLAMEWVIVAAFGIIILYAFSAETILGWLTVHREVITAALPYTAWMCACIAVGGIAFIFDGLFYGLARPRLLIQSVVISALIYAPIAYLAYTQQSSHLLWLGLLLFTASRAIVLVRPVKRALDR